MEKKLASVFQYFAVFDYFPSFEDVYAFFPVKILKKKLKKTYEAKKYTLGEYSKLRIKRQEKRKQISKDKLKNWRFRLYIKFLSLFSSIKLIGLSGSIAMMNADEDDDIDLFIISTENRLFTARFICLILAQIFWLRRKRGEKETKNKVCLNLFFDEIDLKIPKYKQTLFVGHEVLQMKPIINKSQTYEKFLNANKWALSFFPNSSLSVISRNRSTTFKAESTTRNLAKDNFFENILKNLQLNLINRHKTSEIVTDTQLWFHPDDFGKKIEH